MSFTDLQSQVTDHSLPFLSDDLQNACVHEMKHQVDLPQEFMSPSLPLTRSHTTPPYTSPRLSLSSKKRSSLPYPTRKKFQFIRMNLVPISFIIPRTLDFQMHEAPLNRLGLWDFIHLKFDVPICLDLLAELITTYNHSKHYSIINGRRVTITRAKFAYALKLPLKKGKHVIYEAGSAEESGTPFSADSLSFLEDFLCKWILLHDDIWIMPREAVKAIDFIRNGQPLMVDWARLIWLMAEKEMMQGRKITSCHYASHLMCLLKSQVEYLFPDVKVCGGGGDSAVKHKDGEIIEEKDEAQARENEEEDGCDAEDDKISADEEGDLQMEEQGEDDHTVTGDTEKQEQDGEEREDTVEEDENDQEATKSHGIDVHGMELSLTNIENKDCSDEISADFENDMVRNTDLVPCLRRCDTAEEGDVDEISEMEIEEHKNYTACGFGAIITPTDRFSSIPSMFAGHISSCVPIEHDKYPSKFMFGTQLSSSTDISIPSEARHKRLRMDNDMDNTFEYDDSDTYFEHIQLLLRRWKSSSDSKHRQFEETIMGQECLLRELHHREAMIGKLYRDRGEELQRKQEELHLKECELLQMEHLLSGYKDAFCRSQAAFKAYVMQHPQPVKPVYRDVDGGDGLMLSAVEVERMEEEKAEKEKLMISVEKMVKEVEEKWCGKMDGYLHQADLLNKRLQEKVIDVSDIKELFARRKVLKQQACSSPV